MTVTYVAVAKPDDFCLLSHCCKHHILPYSKQQGFDTNYQYLIVMHVHLTNQYSKCTHMHSCVIFPIDYLQPLYICIFVYIYMYIYIYYIYIYMYRYSAVLLQCIHSFPCAAKQCRGSETESRTNTYL